MRNNLITIDTNQIESNDNLTLNDIDDDEFRQLLSINKNYALNLCAQEYVCKFIERCNKCMDQIALSDDNNRQIIEQSKNLLQMDSNGQYYINKPECSRLFYEKFNSLCDIKTKKVDWLKLIPEVLNIPKKIKKIDINIKIIQEIGNIKEKYIYSDDDRYNIRLLLTRGVNDFHNSLTDIDFEEKLEYIDIHDLLPIAIESQGCLGSFFNEFEYDITKLKDLIEKHDDLYY